MENDNQFATLDEVSARLNERTPANNEERICQKCKGRGYFSGNLMNLGTRKMVWHEAISCDFPGCHNGKVNIEENRRITK